MNVIDRRRICGPPNAKPLVFAQLPEATLRKHKVDFVRENDVEARITRTFIQSGLVSNANGSSYVEVDGNIVSVSIYGPRPIRGSFTDTAGLSVALDDVGDVLDELLEKKFCTYIENSFVGVINLAKYPKSGIDIFINVISVQDVESLYLKLLGIISDATTLALINANIELLDIVTSGFDATNNTIISFVRDEVVGMLSEASNPLTNLKEIMAIAQENATVMKKAIVSYLLESAQSC
ncbi:MTR3 [Cyberlindnera jadinii]|uniref:MTR3 protein n=1 Tax=Cyberlindnera jadinii (strain ATCC 18201 / CBS 1600 / BCRC 20928 / JCM 3617 / NBRC 0987 / NRRL Y-1542) TaxID=983966 RepID=A0A0H5C1H4_CYBJN|nr:MTR3 [Cyberlindnera jadinii]